MNFDALDFSIVIGISLNMRYQNDKCSLFVSSWLFQKTEFEYLNKYRMDYI